MRRLLMLAVATCCLSACAPARHFVPQTLEGARCKLDCIDRASIMLVGASYGRCIDACMDIDRLTSAAQTPAP
jgi:hypothetical protein